MSSSEQSTDNPVANTNPAVPETAAENNEAPQKNIKKPKQTKSRASLLLVFILLLLAVSAAGFYFWQTFNIALHEFQAKEQQQSNYLAQLSGQLKDSEALIQQHSQNLTQISAMFTEQQAQLKALSESQQTIQTASKNIFDITHRNQSQWLLAEVSYLLSLANQRLIISRDIKTAIAALKSANNRLHDLSDPSLLGLRQKIASEVAELNLLKLPDINGMAFSLDNITLSIKELPFKSAQKKLTEQNQTSQTVEISSLENDTFLSPLWDRIKTLVTIKKHQRDIQAAVKPLEKPAIDNQLLYRIETSRLALLNTNTEAFQHEINAALALVSLHYDNDDNRVSELLKDLTGYSKINLLPSLPDITGSWLLLQKRIAVSNAGDSLKNNKGNAIQ